MDLTGIGSIADLAHGIMDKFIPPKATEAERLAVNLQLQDMLQKREASVLDVQKSVMVAEMGQEDKFTKRARPMVVYAGLVFIGMVHVLFPIMFWMGSKAVPTLALPDNFWMVWGGVCSVWIVGRSAEKLGIGSDLVSTITGSKK